MVKSKQKHIQVFIAQGAGFFVYQMEILQEVFSYAGMYMNSIVYSQTLKESVWFNFFGA